MKRYIIYILDHKQSCDHSYALRYRYKLANFVSNDNLCTIVLICVSQYYKQTVTLGNDLELMMFNNCPR